MTRGLLAALTLAAAIALTLAARTLVPDRPAPPDLPSALTDREFWTLIVQSSEPDGYFRNENITNLTSNELRFQEVIPDLVARVKPGGVYLGVGPEQNYTYIAALRPRFVVIFDVRRGNLDLQLMYKALFEAASDRADFLSMLFARPRPAGLGPASTAAALFDAFGQAPTSQALAEITLRTIDARLTETHALPLTAGDLNGIREIYDDFVDGGFAVRPSPTYADLMTSTDDAGVDRSFLASEDRFAFVKALEARDLVVPVVGDFAGPKAIRAIGRYLAGHGATVGAFYLSNVEQYLEQDGTWRAFCRNAATLPLDPSSTFIRSTMGGGPGYGRFGFGGFVSSLGNIEDDVKQCR